MFELTCTEAKGTGCCAGVDPNNSGSSNLDSLTVDGSGILPEPIVLPTDCVDVLTPDSPGEIKAENPTQLFNEVEGQRWESVLTFLETGRFEDSACLYLGANTPCLSREDIGKEVATWVDIKDWWGNVTGQRLPIHSAIIHGAPLKVIYKLLDASPNCVRATDSEGNLPLHLAFKHEAADTVTAFLLKAFPEASGIQNNTGQRPVDYADADAGEIIQLCVDQTNTESRKEEARLSQALEAEKLRLREILEQLSDIRSELDYLRRLKSESIHILARDNRKKKKSDKYVDRNHPATTADLDSASGVAAIVSSPRKKKGRMNSKLKLKKWMRKRVDGGGASARAE